MFEKFNSLWDKRTVRRLNELMAMLKIQHDWYATLPREEQFKLAIAFQNAGKVGAQRYKIVFADALPLVLSTLALLAALMK